MRGKHVIVPSVLERSVARTQRRIDTLKTLGAPLQLDLMDGRFVRTRSMARTALRRLAVPPRTTAHLMVTRPMAWVPTCRTICIRRFAVHIESDISERDVRSLTRSSDVLLVLNPGTDVRKLVPFMSLIGGVQVMTVHPGRQGSPFVRSQLAVVRHLRKQHRTLWIAADGGMNARTIPLALAAGVNEFIVGSDLTRAADPESEYRRLAAMVGARAEQQ